MFWVMHTVCSSWTRYTWLSMLILSMVDHCTVARPVALVRGAYVCIQGDSRRAHPRWLSKNTVKDCIITSKGTIKDCVIQGHYQSSDTSKCVVSRNCCTLVILTSCKSILNISNTTHDCLYNDLHCVWFWQEVCVLVIIFIPNLPWEFPLFCSYSFTDIYVRTSSVLGSKWWQHLFCFFGRWYVSSSPFSAQSSLGVPSFSFPSTYRYLFMYLRYVCQCNDWHRVWFWQRVRVHVLHFLLELPQTSPLLSCSFIDYSRTTGTLTLFCTCGKPDRSTSS